jgi:hypothetical protein
VSKQPFAALPLQSCMLAGQFMPQVIVVVPGLLLQVRDPFVLAPGQLGWDWHEPQLSGDARFTSQPFETTPSQSTCGKVQATAQAPLVQVAVPFAGICALQLLLHRPQLSGFVRSDSHPFASVPSALAPSQSANVPLQLVLPHTPAVHVWFVFGPPQDFPQAPQLLVSLSTGFSQPSLAMLPLQSAHRPTHWGAVQAKILGSAWVGVFGEHTELA